MADDVPAADADDRDSIDWSARPTTVKTVEVVREYDLGKNNIVRALKGVSIEVKRGEYVSIMGPSGSGKTTLFNMVGGLDRPTRGKVYIDDVDISELDEFEMAWLRCRKIGYIFQTFNLIAVMTALENVTLPMVFAGASPEECEAKGLEILDRVGLKDRARHKPYELSGGQQQRVAIARAFANDPAIILADEPTGNLDLKTGKQIIDLIKIMNREAGVTVITATHDLKMLSVSDRIIWVRDGLIDRQERRDEIHIDVGTLGDEDVA